MSKLLQFDPNTILYCCQESAILDSPYDFFETVARLYALANYEIFKHSDCTKDSFQVRGYFDNCAFVLKDHHRDNKIHIYADSDMELDKFNNHLIDLLSKVEPKPYQAKYHGSSSENYYYPPI